MGKQTADLHSESAAAGPAAKMSTVHHPKPEIVYEDEDILILNKPVGILSQKAEKNDYSANEMVIDYLLESGQLTRAELQHVPSFHLYQGSIEHFWTSDCGKTIRGRGKARL